MDSVPMLLLYLRLLLVLLAAYASLALLVWGVNYWIARLVHGEEPKVLAWLRWSVWLLALLALETWLVSFDNKLECYWEDVQVWNHLNGWHSVMFFVGLNSLFVDGLPSSRSGGALLLRLGVTLFLTMLVNEFLTLASESWMLRQHSAAGMDPASLYQWAGGSNPRLGSHGLADYGVRTFDGWLRSFTDSLWLCGFLLPFLISLEWLRLGTNPFRGLLKRMSNTSPVMG